MWKVIFVILVHCILETTQVMKYFSKRIIEPDVLQVSLVETYCFNGIEYSFFNYPYTWTEAKMDCEVRNMEFAEVLNNETAWFISMVLAEFNEELEDMWIGSKENKGVWQWDKTKDIIFSNYSEEAQFPLEDYPPWAENPKDFLNKNTSMCMAIDRRDHDWPMFVILPCNIKRGYICQKDLYSTEGPTTGGKVKVNGTRYTLYYANSTWEEAVTFCRTNDKKIATVDSQMALESISQLMMRKRPIMETAWLGGKYSKIRGEWVWITSSTPIDNTAANSSSPIPWHKNPRIMDGCLLLDRHLCSHSVFLAARCDKKQNIVCQEVTEKEDGDKPDEETGPGKFQISSRYRTWEEARTKCKQHEGRLFTLTSPADTAEFMINNLTRYMSHAKVEMRHMWLGARYEVKTDRWYWVDTEENDSRVYIDYKTFAVGDVKFCYKQFGMENRPDMTCLNLDRENHNHMQLYGLPCDLKQKYMCYIP